MFIFTVAEEELTKKYWHLVMKYQYSSLKHMSSTSLVIASSWCTRSWTMLSITGYMEPNLC